MSREIKELLEGFLQMSEDDVISHFARYPGAKEAKQYVYIPGKRRDRVLCVAHADTVDHGNKLKQVLWLGDVVMRPEGTSGSSGWRNSGVLGADDRAGCAMMAHLWDGGHSLLVTRGEERGCVGARAAAEELKEELGKHQFAIEVDRRGDRQCVFYDVGTTAFEKHMLALCTAFDRDKVSWSRETGSCTDIKEICPEVGICGVNLSAGYWNEHSSSEMLLLGAWLNTQAVMKRILKQEAISRFPLAVRAPVSHGRGAHGEWTSSYTTSEEDKLYYKLYGEAYDVKNKSHKAKKQFAKKIHYYFKNGKITRFSGTRLLDEVFGYDLSGGDRKKYNLPYTGERKQLPVHSSASSDANKTQTNLVCFWCRCVGEGKHFEWCQYHPDRVSARKIAGMTGHHNTVIVLDGVRYCGNCGSQLPKHSPSCVLAVPDPSDSTPIVSTDIPVYGPDGSIVKTIPGVTISRTNRAMAAGQAGERDGIDYRWRCVTCMVWQNGKQEAGCANPQCPKKTGDPKCICGADTRGQIWHTTTCPRSPYYRYSRPTNSRVGAQKEPPKEVKIYICEHYCPTCKSPYSHRKIKPVCAMDFSAACAFCSSVNAGIVARAELDASELLKTLNREGKDGKKPA